MPVTRSIAEIKAYAAAKQRPKGFVDLVLALGTVNGDNVTLDDMAARQVREKYPMLGMPGVFSKSILQATAPYHPSGFIDFVFARGKHNGDFIVLDRDGQSECNKKFPPSQRPKIYKREKLERQRLSKTINQNFIDFLYKRGIIVGDFVVLTAELRNKMRPKKRKKVEARFTVAQLKEGAFKRPTGYIEFILANGKVEGETVVISPDLQKIVNRRFPQLPTFHTESFKAFAHRRPPGLVDFVLAHGRVVGKMTVLDAPAAKIYRQKFPYDVLSAPSDPTVAEMATNFSGAMIGWAKAGFKTVEREVYEKRLATCDSCEQWDGKARGGMGKCKICGCTKLKFWLSTARCPHKPPKW